MSTATAPPGLPASYLALLRAFPLRPIRSVKEYEAAAAVLDRLAVRDNDDLDAGERDYLGTLELLIEAYDDAHVRIDAKARTPLEWLRALMKSSGTTAADLQKVLGLSQSAVSLMLHGKRGISKPSIAKLAAHFRVEPSVFVAATSMGRPTRR